MIQIGKWEGREPEKLAEQIVQLLSAAYGRSPWSLQQIEADLCRPSVSYCLARDGAELLGFLALQENDFEAEILQIAVQPASQGQGLATALLAQLPTDREIFLEVRESNQPAYGVYLKAGFEILGRRKEYYHAPVEDAIIMKRDRHEG